MTHDLARSAGNGGPPPLAGSGMPGPSAPAGHSAAARRAARQALSKAVSHLTALQQPEGWWQGELETNVTMDAEDLLLREFLGIRTDEETEAAARWIRSVQRDDGTWANFRGGDGDLSTTVEAYVALRLAGDRPAATHMAQAAAWIRDRGGIAATRVFTRIWLALFGEWPWDELPVMPPELIYLPRWFPLNVYDWACWARQTIVPLTVVCSMRPVRALPFSLDELDTQAGQRAPGRSSRRDTTGTGPSARDPWGAVFRGLDRVLHRYERHAGHLSPATAIRTAAYRRCAEWIIARQERDGCWGGIQPPWVYSLMALHLLGYGLDHPVIEHGLAGLDRFTIWEDGPDGKMRRLEACQSPVWDTVLAMIALADAGLPANHAALQSAARWVLDEEIRGPGDWQVQRPGLAPAGWAFEFDNDGYPDIDDTAEVVLALGRVEQPDDAVAGQAGAAVARALTWLTGMQSRDGGWGAFDADNTSKLVTKLPFCDFGEVVDPPSADVTAHTVEALAAAGPRREQGRAPRGRVAAASSGARWFLVRALGRELRLWHRGGRAGAHYRRRAAGQALHHASGELADLASEPGRRLGRGHALVHRSFLGRARRFHGIADGLGAASPARGRRRRRHAERGTWRCLAGRQPASGRDLGRAAVHRHRIPRRLLHQLPPIPARLPRQCARPVPGR